MRKKFNTTGNCISSRHFMVDTSHKLESIFNLIEAGEYFTINRPRQFGKTTTISLLNKKLAQKPEYLSIKISFEDGGNSAFESSSNIIRLILDAIIDHLEVKGEQALVAFIEENLDLLKDFKQFSRFIRKFVLKANRKVVLIIDEVDKASNYHVFLNFLALLRDKYIKQRDEEDFSFHSVILAGVTDIKHLRSKIRNDGDLTINSPWNIAADFKVDLSFSTPEIAGMLNQYTAETGYKMDSTSIAERIYYYTSGYPFLVSAMCKHVDEEILPQRENKNWTLDDVEETFKHMVKENTSNRLYDEVIKNIFNNENIYALIIDISINGERLRFNTHNELIGIPAMYGILKSDEDGMCKIHNRIFEKVIYDAMLSKIETTKLTERKEQALKSLAKRPYETIDGKLDLKLALQAFQKFMKENYSDKDEVFLETHGRLLFLSFLRPILNGQGFSFKEPVVGNERRMDIVITYHNTRFVLELKRWLGESYHQKGLQQLSDYLDLYDLKEGFLLIYDFRKEKVYKEETISFNGKEIFMVWV